jgi:DNA polymerase-3 subunit epsilon
LRLARHLKISGKNSLTALTAHLSLSAEIDRLASGSQSHRALWDIIAAALLLTFLGSPMHGWAARSSPISRPSPPSTRRQHPVTSPFRTASSTPSPEHPGEPGIEDVRHGDWRGVVLLPGTLDPGHESYA